MFEIWLERKLNPNKSATFLPMQNGMHKSSKHFSLGCNLMPKLHCSNWLADIVCVLLTLQSISCVTRPKIYCIKYRCLGFLLKICLHTHFCESFEIWPWKIFKKSGFEIWLKDFREILPRLQIWVIDSIWDLPITGTQYYSLCGKSGWLYVQAGTYHNIPECLRDEYCIWSIIQIYGLSSSICTKSRQIILIENSGSGRRFEGIIIILTYNDRDVTHLHIKWGVAVGPNVIGAGTRHLPPSRIHAPVTNPH